MNKFQTPAVISFLPKSQLRAEGMEDRIRIRDERVAQLIIALHEIDAGIKAVRTFSEEELSQIVADAILACGFKDLEEARRAMGSILEKIEFLDLFPTEDL